MEFVNYFKSFFYISYNLAKTSFKLKNEGSYLGILWYLFNPLFMFFILYAIFYDRLGYAINNYVIYLFLGVVLFNLFQSVTLDSSKIFILNANLLKAINFKSQTLVLSIVIRTFFSHLFEFGLLFFLILFFGELQFSLMLYFPFLFIYLIFVYGFSLILASINVYFVDLENIWSFFVRILFFATPIFYAIEGQSRLMIINYFNPVYYFINLFREVLIYNRLPELFVIVGCFSFAIFFLFLGNFIFNKLNKKMNEMI